jgi:hypothetical protein
MLNVAGAIAGVLLALGWALSSFAAEPSLAIINAHVSSAEDSPAVASDYKFLPGDYLYFAFEVTGFAVHSEERNETRKISLQYDINVEDDQGRALAPPVSGDIQAELSPEDKDWVPKRRASFLLPSFIAAGQFHIRAVVKDLFGKTETTRSFPFLIGGTQLKPAAAIVIENFRFLRGENDSESLTVPAYSPGDTVYARFEMTGFHTGSENRHHVAYGVTVFAPDGKPFIQEPRAADLDAGSFYPAQFIPGDIALRIRKNSARGQYVVIVVARDLLSGAQFETKQAFSIE